jgi:hypothetical protein
MEKIREDAFNPTHPNQPAHAYLIRPTRIPDGFAVFTVHCGLELSKPDGHGSGGQTGQNLPEPTHAQPYYPLLTGLQSKEY